MHPNHDFIPTADGCGADGLILNPKLLPNKNLEKCCVRHDYCYGTCFMSKKFCDDSFKACMHDVCGSGLCALKCKAKAEIFSSIAEFWDVTRT